jgi:lysophospholipase L1-like esterase
MTDLSPGDRYVALGSSFAAGPGLRPRSPGSPRHAMRSSINYAHLLADRLGLQLTDVSWSGPTAAQIAERLPGRPAQLEAVTADTALVTLTCGGNDVGYIPRLTRASLPRSMQHLMGLRRCIAEIGDVPRGGAAYHPNAAGMRAVADLLVDALGRSPSTSPRPVAGSISSSTAVS